MDGGRTGKPPKGALRRLPALARSSHRPAGKLEGKQMAESEVTVEILKDIREAARGTNTRLETLERSLGDRLDAVTDRLDVVAARLDDVAERLELVETTLLDAAEQNQLILRHTRSLSERQLDLESRVRALETRVDKLESN
jgi:chromosome segregation ATPase